MANPGAYLDRVGRGDLDNVPTPPKSLPWLRESVRGVSQPGRRALDQHAREQARIRASGELP